MRFCLIGERLKRRGGVRRNIFQLNTIKPAQKPTFFFPQVKLLLTHIIRPEKLQLLDVCDIDNCNRTGDDGLLRLREQWRSVNIADKNFLHRLVYFFPLVKLLPCKMQDGEVSF